MSRTIRLLTVCALAVLCCACATTPFSEPIDPPEVYLVNIVPQRGGMLEQTMRIDLRIENPNNVDLSIDGISLELFDYVADPLEATDLEEEHPERVKQLMEKLIEFRALEPRGTGEVYHKQMTVDELEHLEDLGYVEGMDEG